MILRVQQYDLLTIPIKQGQIYFCTDTRTLYKDFGTTVTQRQLYPALVINSNYERLNSIRPVSGRNYYVSEDNSLWIYDTKWVLKDGDKSRYNGYTYGYDMPLNPVTIDNEGAQNEFGDIIIDNNGLLRDGSVVVRDSNRIIKGILESDSSYRSLAITSYLESGISLRPFGMGNKNDRESIGVLNLTISSKESGDNVNPVMIRKGRAEYNGDLYIRGDLYRVDEVNPVDFKLSHIPSDNQEMYHSINVTRSEETFKIYYAITINVTSETEASVRIITYTNDNGVKVIKDSSSLFYDGAVVEGTDITYEAVRSIKDDNNVSYSVIGYNIDEISNNLVITLTGDPVSSASSYNYSKFSDSTQDNVASHLSNIVKIN